MSTNVTALLNDDNGEFAALIKEALLNNTVTLEQPRLRPQLFPNLNLLAPTTQSKIRTAQNKLRHAVAKRDQSKCVISGSAIKISKNNYGVSTQDGEIGKASHIIPVVNVEAGPVLGYSDPYTPQIVIFLRQDWERCIWSHVYLYWRK